MGKDTRNDRFRMHVSSVRYFFSKRVHVFHFLTLTGQRLQCSIVMLLFDVIKD